MPANLTPHYRKAEAALRKAETPSEQLECLQLMLREMPKHKGTDRLQADVKSRIAKLKNAIEQNVNSKLAPRSSAARLPRQGAGRVLLIGPPNVGKSQLLASLTRAQPEIAAYPFTTRTPLPGMMAFQDCPIQLIDLPAMTAESFSAETLELIRSADLVWLVVDLSSDTLVEETTALLSQFSCSKTRLGRQSQIEVQELGVSTTQTLAVLNKSDVPLANQRRALLDEFVDLPFDVIEVSALCGDDLDSLRRETFERLQIVRVYTKHPQSEHPDLTRPVLVRRGDTLVEVARQLHAALAHTLRGGRVWSQAVSFAESASAVLVASAFAGTGELVKPDYQPQDCDIIELHAARS